MRISKYLEHSPVFAICAAYEAVLGRVNRDLKTEKVNFLQGLILTALFFETRDSILPSELAVLLKTSRGNVSHMISDLEAKGFVKRSVGQSDARQFHISLKAEGRKKAMLLIQYFNQLQEGFEKELGLTSTKKISAGIHRVRESYTKGY
ncbi:MAG: MarR family transcriptional regulator [Bdellovibrionales bacterium]|nr:MarR family transcriptional regulator [Bdellovibrionales bacterium]